MIEGDHAIVKTVAKKKYSAALVSIQLRVSMIESSLASNPEDSGHVRAHMTWAWAVLCLAAACRSSNGWMIDR